MVVDVERACTFDVQVGIAAAAAATACECAEWQNQAISRNEHMYAPRIRSPRRQPNAWTKTHWVSACLCVCHCTGEDLFLEEKQFLFLSFRSMRQEFGEKPNSIYAMKMRLSGDSSRCWRCFRFAKFDYQLPLLPASYGCIGCDGYFYVDPIIAFHIIFKLNAPLSAYRN